MRYHHRSLDHGSLGLTSLNFQGAIFAAACTFLINVLSQRPLEDTTQDRELLEKCLELFGIMEKRCHTASILLYVQALPGPTNAYSSTSSIIGGIVREPNFNPLGPHARRDKGGKGWVVNASQPAQPSTSTNITGSAYRSSSTGATEGDVGPDRGSDTTFA